ncbi:glycosyltransferase family 2 protein [Rhodoferax sp. GW822-FHT02A01]|uniref:glycosyltransferase family 2 protein n=1 Tax=Rhodoferax sp. GW822-FHT02A01 TaxID=3141537 RepID=UPI00315D235F
MANTSFRNLKVAVLVPCYNEGQTVASVVRDFRKALPEAVIYVYDNNSKDDTVARAKEAGAVVRGERSQGKGNVIRRMFADIDADLYVMVDGDDTYDASCVPSFLEYMLANNLDMVNGERIHESEQAYRFGHQFGNRLLTGLVGTFFRKEFNDMLSGLKIFSRRFVKSFPALTRGFDIETELTVHALEMRMAVGEMTVAYRERPEGSISKLSTYRDGWRILTTIARFLKEERPMQFFGACGAVLAILSLGLSVPLIMTFLETGLVPRLPTAVLVVGLMLTAVLSVTAGLILDTVTRGRQEMKRLLYLSVPATQGERV